MLHGEKWWGSCGLAYLAIFYTILQVYTRHLEVCHVCARVCLTMCVCVCVCVCVCPHLATKVYRQIVGYGMSVDDHRVA